MADKTRESNVDVVKIEQVIHVYSVFGKGVEGDPVRVVHEYYTLEGKLIARVDTWKEAQEAELQKGKIEVSQEWKDAINSI